MNRFESKMVQGYMTVEATLVFVTVMSVIMFVIFCGFYQYERCIAQLDTYYEIQQSLRLGQPSQDYVKVEAHKASAQREVELPFWIGLSEKRSLKISVEAEMKQLQPAYVLRLGQRLKRIKNDRDRENESAIFQNHR